jgi:hypothetical protein
MTFSTLLLLVLLPFQLLAQTNPPRTTEELFSALHDYARAGRFPSDEQLLDLGFRRSGDAGVELNADSGQLYVLVDGNNRNNFSMTWTPHESAVVPQAVLAALMSKSLKMEFVGRVRLKVTLNQENSGPAGFSEGLIVGLTDGRLYSTFVEAAIP